MTTGRRTRAEGWRKWFSLLLSLALALNLLGPAFGGLPQKDGYIPVCTGSEIVYIPFGATDPDLPSQETPEPVSERCPWFAQFHAVEISAIAADYDAVIYRLAPRLPADSATAAQQTPASFQARAPPAQRA